MKDSQEDRNSKEKRKETQILNFPQHDDQEICLVIMKWTCDHD